VGTVAEAAKVGQTIKRLRRESGMSLSELAARSEVSKGYLWKLERGEAEMRPSAKTLYKIARALGTSMSALMGKAVLVEEPVKIPASLRKFAKEARLGERDEAMLAQVNFRGKQPERPEDWALIWHAIRRSVPDGSGRGRR
jgi:transcriptional regulator with XRE-family HTH domain